MAAVIRHSKLILHLKMGNRSPLPTTIERLKLIKNELTKKPSDFHLKAFNNLSHGCFRNSVHKDFLEAE
jgi:hypothetical protein